MLLVAGRQASFFFFIVLLFISQLFCDNAGQQCGAGGDLYSIYQMMLKGHTWNAETLVALMSDVKATTSLCSLQYAS